MQNNVQSYLRYLDLKYSDEALKVLLSKILVVCGPVFQFMSTGVHAPLGIVVESENMVRDMADELSGFSPAEVFPISILPKEMKKLLEDEEREVIFLRYGRSKRAKENIKSLEEFCQIHYEKIVVIYFVNIVPEEVLPYLAGQIRITTCHSLKDTQSDECFLKFLIDFVIKNYEWLAHCDIALPIIEFEEWLEEDEELKAVKKAYQLMKELGDCLYLREEYFTALSKSVCQILLEWQGDLTKNEVVEWFLRLLWKAANQVHSIRDKSEYLSLEEIEQEQTVLYDSDTYYLTENFFRLICRNMSDSMSISALKEQMAEAGILMSEGASRTYLSRKVNLHLINGKTIRRRRICLNRAMIDRGYTFSWLETIKFNLQKEGYNQ